MSLAMATLGDGRVLTGGGNRALVWDPNRPGAAPIVLGEDASEGYVYSVNAVGVFADGRVVTGGDDMLVVWDPDHLDVAPIVLGANVGWVRAVAVLADGRVVTGGDDGRVLAWDPARSDAAPVLLGEHSGGVWAVTVLADGRVVTSGGDRMVRVWDSMGETPLAEIACHASAVAASASAERRESRLALAEGRAGWSLWSLADRRGGTTGR